MAPINVSRSEQQALDEMVGRAILDKQVERDLLKQNTRQSILKDYVLSSKVKRHLMSLNDMLDVAELADALYRTIKH